jgi:hypothetical protein
LIGYEEQGRKTSASKRSRYCEKIDGLTRGLPLKAHGPISQRRIISGMEAAQHEREAYWQSIV